MATPETPTALYHSVEPFPLTTLRVPPLRGDEVHLWHVRLSDVGGDCYEECLATLNSTEHGRAERYHFEEDRRQFIASRGLLRIMLAQYQEVSPEDLHFDFGEFGKPFLSSGDPLFFNVSHSWNHLLFGITRRGEIGVDVEELRIHENRLKDLTRSICSPKEEKFVSRMSDREAESALTRLWTAKESFLKAVGAGLQIPPSRVELERGVLLGEDQATGIRQLDKAEGKTEAIVYPLADCEKRFGCSAALCIA